VTTISAGDAAQGWAHGLTLLDWRRRVHALYAAVRAAADPAAAHSLWRDERDELFRRHPQSPVASSKEFVALPVAAYDPRWRFEVGVDPAVEPLRIEVPTATDGVVPFERIGVVRLPDVGSLDVWALRSYGGGIFVPFRDRTAGVSTYGAGRYLIDTVKGADLGGDVDLTTGVGSLVLDFNFAYHPSCAYDPAWVCPLAQPGNVLDVEVPVGESLPAGGWY
jgi:uncharacterized protein (DUF1684 family)